ncbi:MAG: tetratricopeptide repeat protein, partial [Planctomycetota bacterium]
EGAKAAFRDLIVKFPDPAIAAEAKSNLERLEGKRAEGGVTEGRTLKVMEKLRAGVSLNLAGKTFDEILEALRKALGVNVGVDDAALDRVDRKRPREFVFQGTGAEALEWFLRPLDLGYRTDPEGVWIVSRRAERWTKLLREEFAAAPDWLKTAKGATVDSGALVLKAPAEIRPPLSAEGNAAVEFDLAFGPEGASIEVTIAADAAGAGYRARLGRVKAAGPGAPLPGTLFRGAAKVAEAARLPEPGAASIRVRFERLHERVRLLLGDRPVLAYDDMLPLPGAGHGGIVIKIESGEARIDNLEIQQLPVPLHRTFLALADDLLSAGDADRAIQQYEGVIRNFPAEDVSREAQFKMGLARLQKGDPALAIAEFRKTIDLYPKSEYASKAACGIWAALLAMEKFDEARSHARTMRPAYPGEEVARTVGLVVAEGIVEAYRKRAAALSEKDAPEAAAAWAEAAETADYLGLSERSLAVRTSLGDSARRKGDLALAAEAYAAGLRAAPQSPEAVWVRMRLAEVALLSGKADEARAAWKSVLAEAPDAKEACAWSALWLCADALERSDASAAASALEAVRKQGIALPAAIAVSLSDPQAAFPDPRDGGGPYFRNDLEYFRGLRSLRAKDPAAAEAAWRRCLRVSEAGDWPGPLAKKRLEALEAEKPAAPKEPAAKEPALKEPAAKEPAAKNPAPPVSAPALPPKEPEKAAPEALSPPGGAEGVPIRIPVEEGADGADGG